MKFTNFPRLQSNQIYLSHKLSEFLSSNSTIAKAESFIYNSCKHIFPIRNILYKWREKDRETGTYYHLKKDIQCIRTQFSAKQLDEILEFESVYALNVHEFVSGNKDIESKAELTSCLAGPFAMGLKQMIEQKVELQDLRGDLNGIREFIDRMTSFEGSKELNLWNTIVVVFDEEMGEKRKGRLRVLAPLLVGCELTKAQGREFENFALELEIAISSGKYPSSSFTSNEVVRELQKIILDSREKEVIVPRKRSERIQKSAKPNNAPKRLHQAEGVKSRKVKTAVSPIENSAKNFKLVKNTQKAEEYSSDIPERETIQPEKRLKSLIQSFPQSTLSTNQTSQNPQKSSSDCKQETIKSAVQKDTRETKIFQLEFNFQQCEGFRKHQATAHSINQDKNSPLQSTKFKSEHGSETIRSLLANKKSLLQSTQNKDCASGQAAATKNTPIQYHLQSENTLKQRISTETFNDTPMPINNRSSLECDNVINVDQPTAESSSESTVSQSEMQSTGLIDIELSSNLLTEINSHIYMQNIESDHLNHQQNAFFTGQNNLESIYTNQHQSLQVFFNDQQAFSGQHMNTDLQPVSTVQLAHPPIDSRDKMYRPIYPANQSRTVRDFLLSQTVFLNAENQN